MVDDHQSYDAPFSTRGAPYEVVINVLKRLGQTKLDAAFGITGLVSLYIMRWGFQKLGARYPRWSECALRL
jgi:sodium-independent sulfate anion transporter 11